MEFLFTPAFKLFLALSQTGAWIPSEGFLYLLLIFGAFMTATVALSVFTFYEDHYWGDTDFREQLRLGNSRGKQTAPKNKQY